MKILLVEPDYRRTTARKSTKAPDEETLWYPPLGLMKLSRFHKDRGDEVHFVRGMDKSAQMGGPLFTWDRVYITTLFTYHFDTVVRTVKFYVDAVGGTVRKVFVGGIMASLMRDDLREATGVDPITGVLNSPAKIGLGGKANIDLLTPDYELLDSSLYAINDTFYAYATRGCPNNCPWCGVNRIEPDYVPYIDIKPVIRDLREHHGDLALLKMMDNNVLASPELERIVDDLLKLGYRRGDRTTRTSTKPTKQRVVDFNQGLDATHVTKKNLASLAKLNIKPMRIAFDKASERKVYERALRLAEENGFLQFSNYMLYNHTDTPRDLYERLSVNIDLNEEWGNGEQGRHAAKVYSYPMRYAPIDNPDGAGQNQKRNRTKSVPAGNRNWLERPVWTKRFVRNIEIMKGAAHGAISTTPDLARRTIGHNFVEFLKNLYMPEELLRNRNKHEKKVDPSEPKRRPGTGKIEEFWKFMGKLLKKRDERFRFFHDAVTENTTEAIRNALETVEDKELKKWLRMYVKK